jgi:hypothetical protein
MPAGRYKYDSHTRLQLESKEDMRRRDVPSPDEWDAVALTFAEPAANASDQPAPAVRAPDHRRHSPDAPSIKVVPVDSQADEKRADLRGLIRYIENRSDASAIYFRTADSQVACGIGHWRVLTEYSAATFNQEIRIRPSRTA